MTGHSEFYVGYRDQVPAGLSRWTRGAALVLMTLGVLLAASLTADQGPFGPGVFEFGIERQLEGVIRLRPVPALEVTRPGAVNGADRSLYELVAFGKFGGDALVADLEGRRVRLSGTLIYRAGRVAIEVVDGSIEPLDGEVAAAIEPVSLGRVTLVGEIVDSKCWLGVMKPGHLKTHRACAVRCLSGGVPPILLVRGADGTVLTPLLVGSDGRAIGSRLLDLVALPVSVTGDLERHADLLVLKAEPGDVTLVGGG